MKKNYFLIMIVLGFFSCRKEESHTVASPAEVDVYVAGFVSDGGSYDEHPTYWKNGSPVPLNFDDSRPYGTKSARAVSIAVSGNNVYVAGYQLWLSYTRGYLPMGVFWKNGISVDRDSMNIYDTYELRSLAVSNNDTYMVAWEPFDNATYWKNESPISLSNGPEGSAAASIAVSGNDVYVAGISFNRNFYNGNYNRMAKYWKNANPVNLSDGTKDAVVTSIAVSGTDVYVAGSEHNGSEWVAIYWKNGHRTNLTDGLTYADANSIAVSGTDVYVAGTQWDGLSTGNGDRYSIAKYWKNGKPVNLTDGSKWAEARSIAISGTDVYVAGFESDGTRNIAKYWKNGSPVMLGDVSKYSEASSIFLAQK